MSGRPVAIAAALRAADLADLAAEVAAVEGAGADLVHLDLCVPAAACPMLGPALCRALRPHVLTRLDLHLAGLPDPALLAACGRRTRWPDRRAAGRAAPPGLLRAIRRAGAAPAWRSRPASIRAIWAIWGGISIWSTRFCCPGRPRPGPWRHWRPRLAGARSPCRSKAGSRRTARPLVGPVPMSWLQGRGVRGRPCRRSVDLCPEHPRSAARGQPGLTGRRRSGPLGSHPNGKGVPPWLHPAGLRVRLARPDFALPDTRAGSGPATRFAGPTVC
ncbi:MAG: hypothetical protein JKP98_13865 [Rhodobacteraceae bacterium]|nr:hypothetical protein [Paracoccaceae bacterium]